MRRNVKIQDLVAYVVCEYPIGFFVAWGYITIQYGRADIGGRGTAIKIPSVFAQDHEW